ncbi:glycosyltransferase family 2 protein [Escherichia albertii]|uniref:Glycosyltransferase family 2 protein n=1 Tax=Escherichia albertii TaxID=208962 RepID=A0A5A4U956_ESCAL|nr:glycosyltransferase family 2 protein [Escherichia albertii]EFO1270045.1 glycosyltransferase family 2 protein [Escherichia albertii]MCZ8807439.1 glycosyltransferase family 2 protein [Escherichia albertii]MCZ9059408.1 glycosyltransferase family 2 protein [Escherichia albertii]BBM63102.1 glycosyltransferase family 2 protein [Escherichia albertii]
MVISSDNLSVIIPVYNEEKNIINILQSLECQSLTGFNVIVIDDGSKDMTASLVKEYKSLSYSLNLIQQSNMGAAQARENAINFTQSDYLAFIDSDDTLSSDALEKTLIPMLNNESIDISLFELVHIKRLNHDTNNAFIPYSESKLIFGEEAFANCISYWGLHGFGIYKRELIQKAYDIYYKYNKSKENHINNDEVISRICFGLSRYIYLSSGRYYFVQNMDSTTRRVNENYYKVINNAFYLREYIDAEIKCNDFDCLSEADKLLVSTIWGVFVRYQKWKTKLSDETKEKWREAIKKGMQYIKNINGKDVNLHFKSKAQLYIISKFIS